MAKFTPSSAGWLADPYAQYRELREHDPVHWSEELDHWVLTRHADVVAVLKDDRFSATNRPPQRRDHPTMMVTSDPPDHSRLRKPVGHRFVVTSVEAMRPGIERIVSDLLDVIDTPEVDVMAALSRPLPRIVISEMLGLALPQGRALGAGGIETSRIGASLVMPGEGFFQDAIERHKEELSDDLVADLLAAEAGRELSPEEVLDTAIILYAAGQETTAKMIGNGVYHLLAHPGQLRKLRTDPALIAPAADELLRYDAPVHAISRRAIEDVEVGGTTMPKGAKVLCVLAAANRDPAVFNRPEELLVDRAPNPHLAFGTGIHTCLGGLLARVEIQVAVGALFARYPALRLVSEEPEWEGSFIIRGVRELRVALG